MRLFGGGGLRLDLLSLASLLELLELLLCGLRGGVAVCALPTSASVSKAVVSFECTLLAWYLRSHHCAGVALSQSVLLCGCIEAEGGGGGCGCRREATRRGVKVQGLRQGKRARRALALSREYDIHCPSHFCIDFIGR
jgi:hypothetical protein